MGSLLEGAKEGCFGHFFDEGAGECALSDGCERCRNVETCLLLRRFSFLKTVFEQLKCIFDEYFRNNIHFFKNENRQ